MNEIIVEFWGDFACFSPPYSKVERLSYPFPTPSAARGMLSAIYSKPNEFYWQVNKIEVLNPIQYISFKRNEVKSKSSGKFIIADEDRTQRQTVALKDVRYRIHATIVPRENFRHRETQLYEQMHRRLEYGKCFMQPSLGLREFAAYFEEYNPEIHTTQPIDESGDYGLTVYDIFDLNDFEVRKSVSPKLTLYRAVMKHGIIEVPRYDANKQIQGE